jgi:hypothetical protein
MGIDFIPHPSVDCLYHPEFGIDRNREDASRLGDFENFGFGSS